MIDVPQRIEGFSCMEHGIKSTGCLTCRNRALYRRFLEGKHYGIRLGMTIMILVDFIIGGILWSLR